MKSMNSKNFKHKSLHNMDKGLKFNFSLDIYFKEKIRLPENSHRANSL